MTFQDVVDEALCEIWLGRRYPPNGCFRAGTGEHPVMDITARHITRVLIEQAQRR